jgi:hypothetical protein
MMKHSLQLKLGQQLTLTPQLQMAIRLLQLPVLDLQAELREALESNLMLEMDDGLDLAPPKGEQQVPSDDLRRGGSEGGGEGGDAAERAEEYREELPYADVSEYGLGYGSGARDEGDEGRDYADAGGTSLREHLLGQLDVTLPEGDRKLIATMIIDAIDDGNRVKAFDALLDLAYVVYGTALFMGVTPAQWHAGMHAVHTANMAKVRVASADNSKRGSTFDVVKPPGWQGPEARLAEVLSWNE